MPGLPPTHTPRTEPPAAISVPAPFRTATAPCADSAAAACGRRDCTRAASSPSSRPASPGCGVITALAGRLGRPPSAASRFNPSASTTSGLPAARQRASSASAQGLRPSPGPTATALAPSSRSSMSSAESAARTISSGRRASTAVRLTPRVAIRTTPAPVASAASPASSTAPPMSASPPTTAKRPKSPLWAPGRRRRRQSAAPSSTPIPGRSNTSAGKSRGASSSSPTQSTAGPVTRPSLAATKVTVSAAATGCGISRAPVLASTPLGRSRASTGRPAALMRATAAAVACRTSPVAPVPSSASTITSPRGSQLPAAGSMSSVGLGAMRSAANRYAARVSPRSRAGSATATTCTSKPASLASPAST